MTWFRDTQRQPSYWGIHWSAIAAWIGIPAMIIFAGLMALLWFMGWVF